MFETAFAFNLVYWILFAFSSFTVLRSAEKVYILYKNAYFILAHIYKDFCVAVAFVDIHFE
jgi:hypothetical protein